MNLTTYRGHYEACRKEYIGPSDTTLYSSVYDLSMDDKMLELSEEYDDVVATASRKITQKLDYETGCFRQTHALRLNDWRDVEEIGEIAEIVMPQLEEKLFHSNLAVEFVHPYRNMQPSSSEVQSSWKWHYDDCPKEFLKLFIHLNDVTEKNGCMQLLCEPDNRFNVIESSRIGPNNRGAPQRDQKYLGSRVPREVIAESLASGARIHNITGDIGKYFILTPNIVHRATVPEKNTVPRDILAFFIRPTLRKRKYISDRTHSYLPERNVKRYPLD